MPYVDGYVLPVPKKNVKAYIAMAKKAAKVFKEHGALEIYECEGDQLEIKGMRSYPKTLKTKPSETIFFSWITYKSRAHRDKVNAKVMSDPRLASMMDQKNLPMDCKQMLYGGFKPVVRA